MADHVNKQPATRSSDQTDVLATRLEELRDAIEKGINQLKTTAQSSDPSNVLATRLSEVRDTIEKSVIQLKTTPPDPWFELGKQFTVTFLGASVAFGFALWLARNQRQAATTEALINEFSSRDMLRSRFVTVALSDKVKAGDVQLRDIAKSSLQDCSKAFVGETIDGFTEHQHMSHLVGYYRRLALNLRYRWISRKHLSRTIGGSLQWTLPFLLQLANEVEKVAKDEPSGRSLSERAAWVYAVRYVDSQLDKKRFEIGPADWLPIFSSGSTADGSIADNTPKPVQEPAPDTSQRATK